MFREVVCGVWCGVRFAGKDIDGMRKILEEFVCVWGGV